MREVERYLKRATRGLARRQRADVRAELESHIFERMQAIQIEGLAQDEAAARVLGELGPADTANRALRWVHYVHPALNVVVAFGVLAVAWMGWQWRMVSVFPISDTNTPSIFTDPLYPPRTVSSGDSEDQQGHLLSFSQAAAVFKGTPAQIIGNDESAQLVFPGHSSLDLGPAVRRRIDGTELPRRYGFYVAPPVVVSFDDLMRLVLNSKWPLRLDITRDAVKLSVAGHPLNWPPEMTSINAYPFIESWNQQVSALLHQEVMESGFIDWEPLFEIKGHKIPLIVHDLVPREIYALAIKR